MNVYFIVSFALGFYTAYLCKKIKDIKNTKTLSKNEDVQCDNIKVENDKN